MSESAAASEVALVTGAARGIGRSIASALHERGARVIGVDLTVSESSPPDWTEVTCDLRDRSQVEKLVANTLSEHGRLDTLIHAAGITRDRVLWKQDAADWDAVLATNLTAAADLCRFGVPGIRQSGGGAIVFISSINGERGKFGQTAYAASKAGLLGLARSLAREVGTFGIRVNLVAPGLIQTAMTEQLPAEIREQAIQESCLGKVGQPEDVAAAVAFLTSSSAAHITGQVLRVDGGQYM